MYQVYTSYMFIGFYVWKQTTHSIVNIFSNKANNCLNIYICTNIKINITFTNDRWTLMSDCKWVNIVWPYGIDLWGGLQTPFACSQIAFGTLVKGCCGQPLGNSVIPRGLMNYNISPFCAVCGELNTNSEIACLVWPQIVTDQQNTCKVYTCTLYLREC